MKKSIIFLFISFFFVNLQAQNDPSPDAWQDVANKIEATDTVYIRNNLSILNGGKLGLNHTSPAEILHVNGGAIFSGISNGLSDSDWGTLEGKNIKTLFSNRYNGISSGVHGFGVASANHFESPFIYGYDKPGNKIVFGSITWNDRNPATGLTPRMVVNTDNGNVGIGVVNPENALEVCGFIRANEIIVQNDWCDFVFNKDYKLPSLSEQKAFIDTNGHLKNFQSEEEMSGEIHLGDVNKRQQQSIEEMMLYLIKMKEEIDDLKQENQLLKADLVELKKK